MKIPPLNLTFAECLRQVLREPGTLQTQIGLRWLSPNNICNNDMIRESAANTPKSRLQHGNMESSSKHPNTVSVCEGIERPIQHISQNWGGIAVLQHKELKRQFHIHPKWAPFPLTFTHLSDTHVPSESTGPSPAFASMLETGLCETTEGARRAPRWVESFGRRTRRLPALGLSHLFQGICHLSHLFKLQIQNLPSEKKKTKRELTSLKLQNHRRFSG